MPRIVILSRRNITHPLSGGAGRYVHEIFRRLSDRYDVTVLAEGSRHTPRYQEIEGIRYVNLHGPLHRILVPFTYLLKYSKGADVLVDHADVAIPWFSPAFSSTPRITIVHQLVKEIYYYELPRPWADLGFFGEPKMYRLYNNSRIVASQGSTAEELVELGLSEKNISIIRPASQGAGLNLPNPIPLKERALTIVCVSRLMHYKGLQFALRAFAKIARNSPTIKLRIAGTGKYSDELHKLAAALEIQGSVEFLGRVSEYEKFRLLAQSRVGIFPSVRDGYGISVIEANSVGTPVVGWFVPGPKDSIVDKSTGLLAPFPDENAFASCLRALLTDDELWTRFSSNAVKWAGGHSWKESADEFGNVVESLLSESQQERKQNLQRRGLEHAEYTAKF